MQQGTERILPQAERASSADETRQRIMLAAAQVFAEKGYARATTRALAAAAGVNEVTLFRHFGNKQNLFAAIIDEFAAPALTASIESQLTGDYRQDLLAMGKLVMDILLKRQGAMRMMLCEAEHFPEVRQVLAQNPRQLRLVLSAYLEGQMERGLVRELHAQAAAQAFWGMFFAYSISVGLLEEEVEPRLPIEQVVEQYVDIFVQGTVN